MIVIGRVRVRSYDNQQGQTVWVTEIEADEIAPSLRWARAQVTGPAAAVGWRRQQRRFAPPPPSDDDVPF